MKESALALVGYKAPQWTLKNVEEQLVSLSDFKSKVLLINFTGIGCGPCQAAIPALKGLKDKFSSVEFDIVAIESWQASPYSLKNYKNKNGLNYTILCADKEVTKNYKTGSTAPVFLVLDKQRVVKKVIFGYRAGETDKILENAIIELISKE